MLLITLELESRPIENADAALCNLLGLKVCFPSLVGASPPACPLRMRQRGRLNSRDGRKPDVRAVRSELLQAAQSGTSKQGAPSRRVGAGPGRGAAWRPPCQRYGRAQCALQARIAAKP